MAEMLMDALGSANYAVVDDTHRLWVAGSITSMPPIIAAGNLSVTKIGGAGLGSATLTGAYDGVNDVQALRIINGSHLLVAGSISSMPAITTAPDPATTEIGIAGFGSASLMGAYDGVNDVQAGRIDNGSYFLVGGSIITMPTVTVQATNLDIRDLSSAQDNVGVVGSVRISAPPLGVSGTIFDSGKLTGSFATKGIGSVVIKSAPLIGVSGAIFDSGDITGSVVISSSTKLGVSGNVIVSATNLDIRDLTSASDSVEITGTSEIGSVVISSAPLIGVSGAIFDSGDITGSMVISSATKLGVSGIVEVSNVVQTAGSIYSMPEIVIGSVSAIVDSVYIQSGDNLAITSLPGDLGSVVISSAPLLGVSGLIFTDGKMTGSMAVKGIGSVIIKSSALIGVSGLIFTSGKMTGSFAPKGIGSVVIKGAPVLGVSGAIFDSGDITGSVVISQATKLGVSGIVDIGNTVTVDASNLDIRDLTSASDSVEITGTSEIGSVVISSAPLLGVSGPVWVQNPVGISGVNVIGSVVIKSAPLIGVSGLIFTDGNLTGSMAMQGIGSMVISSSNLVGVSGAIFDSGDITGSVVISSAPVLGVSGAKLDALTGSFYHLEVAPDSIIMNNPAWKFEYIISGTATGVAGSSIGSITQSIGAGSYVKKLTWSNNLITNVGSYV